MWKVDTTLSGEGNETLTKGPLILQCVRTPSGSYRVYLKVFGAVLNTHWKAQTLEKAKDLAETLLAEVKNNGDENAQIFFISYNISNCIKCCNDKPKAGSEFSFREKL